MKKHHLLYTGFALIMSILLFSAFKDSEMQKTIDHSKFQQRSIVVQYAHQNTFDTLQITSPEISDIDIISDDGSYWTYLEYDEYITEAERDSLERISHNKQFNIHRNQIKITGVWKVLTEL